MYILYIYNLFSIIYYVVYIDLSNDFDGYEFIIKNKLKLHNIGSNIMSDDNMLEVIY